MVKTKTLSLRWDGDAPQYKTEWNIVIITTIGFTWKL